MVINDFLLRVIKHYGVKNQCVKAVEEMSELTKELCKHVNGNNIIGDKIREEMADVEIMLKQLRICFDVENGDGSVDDIIIEKLERLEKRIGAESII